VGGSAAVWVADSPSQCLPRFLCQQRACFLWLGSLAAGGWGGGTTKEYCRTCRLNFKQLESDRQHHVSQSQCNRGPHAL
jgi:hypothetical protein